MATICFISSLLTFYLKGKISKDDNFINLSIPKTVLGFVPLGMTNKQLLVNQIDFISSGFHLIFGNLIIGFSELIVGIFFLPIPTLSFFIVLLGCVTFINAFQTTLIIHLTSGDQIMIYFSVFEKRKVLQATALIKWFTLNWLLNHLW